jgi:hypothetical protein
MENLTKITKCQNCGHKLEKDEWIFGNHKTLLYFAKPL